MLTPRQYFPFWFLIWGLQPATLAFGENGVCKREEKSTAGAGASTPSLGRPAISLEVRKGLALSLHFLRGSKPCGRDFGSVYESPFGLMPTRPNETFLRLGIFGYVFGYDSEDRFPANYPRNPCTRLGDWRVQRGLARAGHARARPPRYGPVRCAATSYDLGGPRFRPR